MGKSKGGGGRGKAFNIKRHKVKDFDAFQRGVNDRNSSNFGYIHDLTQSQIRDYLVGFSGRQIEG